LKDAPASSVTACGVLAGDHVHAGVRRSARLVLPGTSDGDGGGAFRDRDRGRRDRSRPMGHYPRKRIITRPALDALLEGALVVAQPAGMVRCWPLPSSKAYSCRGTTTAPFLGCIHPPESRPAGVVQESSMAVMRPWCRHHQHQPPPTSSPRSSPSVQVRGPTSMNPSSSIRVLATPISIFMPTIRNHETRLLACLAAGPAPMQRSRRTSAIPRRYRDVRTSSAGYKAAAEARRRHGDSRARGTPLYRFGRPGPRVSPLDYGTLQQKAQDGLSRRSAGVRLEATIKDLDVKGELARLDYFQVLRYAIATPAGRSGRARATTRACSSSGSTASGDRLRPLSAAVNPAAAALRTPRPN